MRDDFTEEVKRTVANRVTRCSNPDCRRPTSGPQVDPTKYVNVGVAAHITAASARLSEIATSYDPTHATLSKEEIDLLIYAAEKGDICVLSSDEIGSWVSIGSRHLLDKLDPAVAAAYVEAVESLCFRRLAKHDGGVLFVLTGTGFKIGRALKGLFDRRSG